MPLIKSLNHEDMKPRFFAGYKKQMDFGMLIGELAIKQNTEYRILLFGFPGTGKTLYPQALTYNLKKEGLDYSLLTVKCNSLRIDSPKHVRSLIKKIESYTKKGRRVILVLDELDIFAQRRDESEYSVYNTATGYIMNLLEERNPSTITLGITNNPYKLDVAVRDRFDFPLYFPMQDTDIESLLKHKKMPKPKETADCLNDMYREDQARSSNRRMLRSLEFIKTINESPDVLNGMKISNNPREMARIIYINSGIPILYEEMEDYEGENASIINKSRMLLDILFGDKKD